MYLKSKIKNQKSKIFPRFAVSWFPSIKILTSNFKLQTSEFILSTLYSLLSTILPVIFIISLTACDRDKDILTGRGGITFQLVWQDSYKEDSKGKRAPSASPSQSTSDVVIVRFIVKDAGGNIIVTRDFPYDAHGGQVTAPAGQGMELCIDALDSEGRVIYQGVKESLVVRADRLNDLGEIEMFPIDVRPPTPGNLVGYIVEDHVILRWEGVIDIQKYLLYYDTDSAWPYEGKGASEGDSPIEIGPDRNEIIITGLENGTIYYFSIVSVGDYGESPLSNEVSITTTPSVSKGGRGWFYLNRVNARSKNYRIKGIIGPYQTGEALSPNYTTKGRFTAPLKK